MKDTQEVIDKIEEYLEKDDAIYKIYEMDYPLNENNVRNYKRYHRIYKNLT